MVFFIHGGWGNNGNHSSYENICAALSIELEATLILPDYPLFPESPLSQTISWLCDTYVFCINNTVKDKKEIILCGDNTGADLCLELLVCLSDNKFKNLQKSTSQILFYPTFEYRNPNMSIRQTPPNYYPILDTRRYASMQYKTHNLPKVDDTLLNSLPNTVLISLSGSEFLSKQNEFCRNAPNTSQILVPCLVDDILSNPYFYEIIHDLCVKIRELSSQTGLRSEYMIPVETHLKISKIIARLI